MKNDLLRKCEQTPHKNLSNLAIKPEKGKAVFWYNHEISPYTGWMGQLEARTIAGVTSVQDKTAWSAKMWINVIGDGVTELKPWRMASNWLKAPNRREDLIERLRNDFFREGEDYLHIHRKDYKQKPAPPPQRIYKENDFLKPVINDSVNENDKKEESGINSTEGGEHETIDKSMITEEISDSQNTIVKTTKSKKILEPIGPELRAAEETPALGFHHHRKRQEVPLGPPKRPIDSQPFLGRKVIENGVLKASLLLVEELEREELEILARNLHEKLQLNCIPLIVNPIR